MSCTEVQTFLKRFLSGKLGGAEARHIREHLASCPRCASALIGEDRIELLPALDEEIEPSEDFRGRFMARLETHRAEAARGPAENSRRALFGYWTLSNRLAAAGALAAVLAFGIYLGLYQSPQNLPDRNPGDIAIAENLPLLQDMKVIEYLEFLEDFDAIQNLSDGGKAPSSVQ